MKYVTRIAGEIRSYHEDMGSTGPDVCPPTRRFVLGLDLDGCCADFYGYMREVAAEWKGVPVGELQEEVSYGLGEWGLLPGEYDRIHHFAVTQRGLFEKMSPIPGAPQAIRHLERKGFGFGSSRTGSSSDGSTKSLWRKPCGGWTTTAYPTGTCALCMTRRLSKPTFT